ncbi:NADPH dehydrogenase [Corchorus capsularis]|uniref:NADPH dehydrogenase n=1 Tax=Corchorus capsularis TaxID=210143 RepID=A0A1R3GLK1_COCAP|nr:NADPH dehydrogenase [Corchorus capsularis]
MVLQPVPSSGEGIVASYTRNFPSNIFIVVPSGDAMVHTEDVFIHPPSSLSSSSEENGVLEVEGGYVVQEAEDGMNGFLDNFEGHSANDYEEVVPSMAVLLLNEF